MGNLVSQLLSRSEDSIEDLDQISNYIYTFPSKSGNYFASHFIMGGERFETCQPEAYLFGENMDLNFLGCKPTPFPYSAPLPHEPTRTLRSLINIRKESLRFVKVNHSPTDKLQQKLEDETANKDDQSKEEDESEMKQNLQNQSSNQYNIEFTFDSDVRCSIAIHYFCHEEITPNGLMYHPRDLNMSSETYNYKSGPNQQFNQSSHIFDPSSYNDDQLLYKAIDEHGFFDPTTPLPIVIHCVAQEGDEPRQSHVLIAIIERNHDNLYSIKPLKQKIFVDGLCYLLQEIYGIENKTNLSKQVNPDEIEDNSSECVICMSDTRDTLILPCRHLCLCNGCADSLRYQANNCPICRSPFRALLQIRAVKKSSVFNSIIPPTPTPPTIHQQMMASNSTNDLIEVPSGYEPISLIEALNGHTSFSLKRSSFSDKIGGGTPINLKKYYNKNELRKKSSTNSFQNNSGDCNSTSAQQQTQNNQSTARSKKTLASPSTPEVVVSSMPLSPEKEVLSEMAPSKKSDVKEERNWRNQRKSHKGDDNGSNSSSSLNSVAENISLQERVRLLSHDKDEDIDYIADETVRIDKLDLEDDENNYKISAISPPLLIKDSSPGNSSPLSIGVSSGSYAMISLRDGVDEQRVMDDADLASITTNSSVANMMHQVISHEDDYESDYFPGEEQIQEGTDFNTTTLLVDQSTNTGLDTQKVKVSFIENKIHI